MSSEPPKETHVSELRVERFDGQGTLRERHRIDDDARPVRVSVTAGLYEIAVFEDAEGGVKVSFREGSGWTEGVPIAILARALKPDALG